MHHSAVEYKNSYHIFYCFKGR